MSSKISILDDLTSTIPPVQQNIPLQESDSFILNIYGSSEEVVDGVIVDVNPSIIKGTVTPICSIF